MKKHQWTWGIWAFLLVALISCGRDNKGTDNPVGETPTGVKDIQSLAGAPDRRALVGESVDISSGEVQQVVGTYIFWAGDTHNQIPVVREDRLRGPITNHVRRGDTVSLGGTVRLVSAIGEDDPLWSSINDDERKQIQAATVYIAADKVEIVSRR